ncbi:aldo/keto reductase [Bifidobacterium sp. ESL0820]
MRGDLSSKAIHREIDGMLRRLVTDYLDLYIIHRFDYVRQSKRPWKH